MKAYQFKPPTETTLATNQSTEGERIEQKINRIVNNKEPITDGAPLVYTERNAGVEPQYNPKTDKWEIAVEAMDKVAQTKLAQRAERNKPKDEPKTDEPAAKVDKPAAPGNLGGTAAQA